MNKKIENKIKTKKQLKMKEDLRKNVRNIVYKYYSIKNFLKWSEKFTILVEKNFSKNLVFQFFKQFFINHMQ